MLTLAPHTIAQVARGITDGEAFVIIMFTVFGGFTALYLVYKLIYTIFVKRPIQAKPIFGRKTYMNSLKVAGDSIEKLRRLEEFSWRKQTSSISDGWDLAELYTRYKTDECRDKYNTEDGWFYQNLDEIMKHYCVCYLYQFGKSYDKKYRELWTYSGCPIHGDTKVDTDKNIYNEKLGMNFVQRYREEILHAQTIYPPEFQPYLDKYNQDEFTAFSFFMGDEKKRREEYESKRPQPGLLREIKSKINIL